MYIYVGVFKSTSGFKLYYITLYSIILSAFTKKKKKSKSVSTYEFHTGEKRFWFQNNWKKWQNNGEAGGAIFSLGVVRSGESLFPVLPISYMSTLYKCGFSVSEYNSHAEALVWKGKVVFTVQTLFIAFTT